MATTKTSKTKKSSAKSAAKSTPAGVDKSATRGTKEYQKTPLLTKEQAEDGRKWWVADVSGKTLGRAATTIAHVLRGKHKASYTPHVDSGDFVIVINADKVKLTGNKVDGKIYYEHTLYPGGIKATPAGKMLQRHPEELMLRAVWGMLPKGPLGRRIYKKLKVYAKATHDHVAQQPEVLTLPNG